MRRLLLFLLLLGLGIFAGTQEADLSGGDDSTAADPEEPGLDAPEEWGVEAPDFVEPPAEEPLPEARWFRSNAGGMILEEVPSRLAALRNTYALGIDYLPPGELPELLAPWYQAPWQVEIHILYRDGSESRRQWIFRDSEGMARLVAVFNQDLLNPPEDAGQIGAEEGGAAETEAPALSDASEPAGDEAAVLPDTDEPAGDEVPGETLTGFIELYNGEGQIITEHLFHEGGEESVTEFAYRRGRLIRAEMGQKIQDEAGERIAPVFTDYYRYNRAESLRAVERHYHEGVEETDSPVRLTFPHMVLDAAANKDFISLGSFYQTGFPADFYVGEDYQVVYTTDERGRILTETWQDDEETVVREVTNTWSGDRLVSVGLKAGDDEQLTEYEYNAEGDRIIERNYRGEVLERQVRSEGDREVEELYMNGVIILRAIWEDGRKISEERVRPEVRANP
jgi:hypothetical protein